MLLHYILTSQVLHLSKHYVKPFIQWAATFLEVSTVLCSIVVNIYYPSWYKDFFKMIRKMILRLSQILLCWLLPINKCKKISKFHSNCLVFFQINSLFHHIFASFVFFPKHAVIYGVGNEESHVQSREDKSWQSINPVCFGFNSFLWCCRKLFFRLGFQLDISFVVPDSTNSFIHYLHN